MVLFVGSSLLAQAQEIQTIKTSEVPEKITAEKVTSEKVISDKVNWMSWEEAMELNKETPKKFYIDVYTDWCGWCKKMDKSTFMDAEVVKYLNDNFYAIKFNAEQKEPIDFNGNKFEFQGTGKRGAHQLAVALLDGRLGYPAFVALDETYARIFMSPGFKGPGDVLKELKFAKEELYKTQSWNDYSRSE